MRVVASVLLAAVALVATGPLAAEAAPPPVTPPVSGILGAVSGLTSALPPVRVSVGQGPGAIHVTVDAGATVRRVLGTAPSAAPAPAASTPAATQPPRTPSGHVQKPAGTAARPSAADHQPARRSTARTGARAAAPAGTGRPVVRHQPRRVAPTVQAGGPLQGPSRAVQALLHWSLGSDRTMLVLLGVTAVGALGAMITVLAMGRRPGLRRAPVR